MEASIFGSILFVGAFVALFISVFQIRKSNDALNGVSWLVLSFVSILCYGTMTAGIINIFKIPVNIISVGGIYLITSIVLQYVIKKEGKKQKYIWEAYDFVCAAVFAIIIILVAGSYFTPSLKLMFFNSDAAVHFKNAKYVLQNEHLVNMYFAPLHNALIMEVFMPFIAEVNLYKIYILIDIVMFWVESAFFMVLVRDFITTKAMKVLGLIIAVLYMLGYPMNSFLYSFFYWAVGVMLIGYMLLMLRYFENGKIERRVVIVGLMICCASIPVTYMLFGPFAYITSFIVLMIYCKRRGKLVTKANILLALKIYLLPTLLAIYYCYFDYLRNMEITALEIMGLDGGVYRDLFINFVWTLPFVVYMLLKSLRNKKTDETIVHTLFFVILIVCMCVLVCKGVIAAYYYYKFYFPVWMFFFVLTVQAVKDLWEKSKDIIISYAVVFGILAFMHFGQVELNVINSQRGLTNVETTDDIFDLYDFNIFLWNSRVQQYPDEYFEICNYVIEKLDNDEKEVPLLATLENYNHCYWFEGITGQNCEEFYGWWYTFEEVQEKIENKQVDYFVVYKNSAIYGWHADYFNTFEHVYENEYGFIAKVK